MSRTKALVAFAVCVLACACAAKDNSRIGGPGNGGGGNGGDGAGGDNTALGGFGGSGQSTGGTGVSGNGGGGTGGSISTDGPVSIDDCGGMGNTSGLSAADLATLMAGGAATDMKYLYPYDGTIFPRGLIAPTLMWQGADDAEAVYVHIKSSLFELKGCYKPTAPGQLLLPQEVWTKAEGATRGAVDPFSIELNVIKGGAAKGPIMEKVIIAQATLKGSIFYNSYASSLSPGAGSVLRIVPGQQVEAFIKGTSFTDCNGCHAMSANGTRLVTDLVTANSASVFALDPTTAPMPAALHSNPGAGFVGLSPDGSVYVTSANKAPTMRAGTTDHSALITTDTGVEITDSGIPMTAVMPTFSPDGSLLVFNDNAITTGKGLAMMTFDPATNKATEYRKIYESIDDKLPGWPFVLPDNHAVVFQLGKATDFSGGNVGIDPVKGFNLFGGAGGMAPTVGPWGNLYLLDVTTGTNVMLAKAMGYDTEADAMAGNSYLPYATDEKDMAYYPTVSPVAAGGYFWVFFDSERHYGNKGLMRQLWGTAITISSDGKYTTDPSHPAFFLTGQEEGTGNHRAFTALTPCKADGQSCETGIDCCGGYCTNNICEKPEQPRCAMTDEVCKTSADCCNKTDVCIAGYCGQVVPQ